jgi:colanic acid/amylovoran biosynthesis glycosyltransferase
MQPFSGASVGYVVKRYPRFSETFIVNEILAHERAGLQLKIFSLRPSFDTHFQDGIARVRSPVIYLPGEGVKANELWSAMHAAAAGSLGFWDVLETAGSVPVNEVFQAIVLARHVRTQGIEHLHAHFATSATTVTRLAARFAGISYSFTAHAKDIFHEEVSTKDLAEKLRDAAAVVTVSDYNVRYLKEQFGEDAQHVVRIYNGLDLEAFPYFAPNERPRRIISVGRLVEKKGFLDLVEACRLLAHRGCNFTCQIVGSGELESQLADQIRQFDLEGKVFLLGPRPQSEVIELVRGSAAFAAPCVVGEDGNRDGLPTVLLEAMALGTPCVSTDVTGIPEILHHGKTGLMVPQRDPLALSQALERLLIDSELRVCLAAQARSLIESRFNGQDNAARVRECFRLAGRRAGLQEVG